MKFFSFEDRTLSITNPFNNTKISFKIGFNKTKQSQENQNPIHETAIPLISKEESQENSYNINNSSSSILYSPTEVSQEPKKMEDNILTSYINNQKNYLLRKDIISPEDKFNLKFLEKLLLDDALLQNLLTNNQELDLSNQFSNLLAIYKPQLLKLFTDNSSSQDIFKNLQRAFKNNAHQNVLVFLENILKNKICSSIADQEQAPEICSILKFIAKTKEKDLEEILKKTAENGSYLVFQHVFDISKYNLYDMVFKDNTTLLHSAAKNTNIAMFNYIMSQMSPSCIATRRVTNSWTTSAFDSCDSIILDRLDYKVLLDKFGKMTTEQKQAIIFQDQKSFSRFLIMADPINTISFLTSDIDSKQLNTACFNLTLYNLNTLSAPTTCKLVLFTAISKNLNKDSFNFQGNSEFIKALINNDINNDFLRAYLNNPSFEQKQIDSKMIQKAINSYNQLSLSDTGKVDIKKRSLEKIGILLDKYSNIEQLLLDNSAFFYKNLPKKFTEIVNTVDKDGNTILHRIYLQIDIDKDPKNLKSKLDLLFDYLVQEKILTKLLETKNNSGDNALHSSYNRLLTNLRDPKYQVRDPRLPSEQNIFFILLKHSTYELLHSTNNPGNTILQRAKNEYEQTRTHHLKAENKNYSNFALETHNKIIKNIALVEILDKLFIRSINNNKLDVFTQSLTNITTLQYSKNASLDRMDSLHDYNNKNYIAIALRLNLETKVLKALITKCEVHKNDPALLVYAFQNCDHNVIKLLISCGTDLSAIDANKTLQTKKSNNILLNTLRNNMQIIESALNEYDLCNISSRDHLVSKFKELIKADTNTEEKDSLINDIVKDYHENLVNLQPRPSSMYSRITNFLSIPEDKTPIINNFKGRILAVIFSDDFDIDSGRFKSYIDEDWEVLGISSQASSSSPVNNDPHNASREENSSSSSAPSRAPQRPNFVSTLKKEQDEQKNKFNTR